MGPEGMDGSVKGVRQVHRSPFRREKGKNSNEDEGTRPEEESHVELHVVMEKLF